MRMLNATLTLLLAVQSPRALAASVPSTARSREAVSRVEPALKTTLEARELSLGSPVFIRIFKLEAELEMWLKQGESYTLYETYPICSFSGELGPKLREGDMQAPEGFYFVNPGRMNPASQFHLSFNLGYPNRYDRSHSRTGSALMVHGSCVSIGCYAMTDAGIEEIWTLMDAAMRQDQSFIRVHIFPFRMTPEKMTSAASSPWAEFWGNLLEGYQIFEDTHIPPNVEVSRGRYVFSTGS